MHVLVALGEIGGGIADALAAVGEDVGDLVDRGTEAPGEEAPPGMMKPRFSLAPLWSTTRASASMTARRRVSAPWASSLSGPFGCSGTIA